MSVRIRLGVAVCGAAMVAGVVPVGAARAEIGPSAESAGLWCFVPERRAAQAAYERGLNARIDADSLRSTHDAVASEPHPAGSEGDARMIEYLRSEFAGMGLEASVDWFDAYLARPVAAELEIVTRGSEASGEMLPLKEVPVEGDDDPSHPLMDIGWNAFSGSGEVTGEVVYANYGTKEDFERLAAMGVECAGKIVLARYGRNYRGYKAKFAEEAGAAGLIMYTDPEDSGYARGLMYPDGGWANEHSIQRGSVKTLEYAGDPLTPGVACVGEVERLDAETIALPRIPVQPVGWVAAERILSAMEGPVVPEAWQGGLGFNYRLEGGEGLRVRLRVEQERGLTRTANVLGVLPGETLPHEFVVVGCHHDAWTAGAGDPTAGLIVVLEMARAFAAEAAAGNRPKRTIVFAGWGAEEFGIVGSTEWVERHFEDVAEWCLGYLNLDMAAMGTRFGASASPMLKGLIADATRDVEQVGRDGVSVHEAWDARSDGRTIEQQIGSLGGGSDHVPFHCHAGVPSMSLGAGGARGTAYHSAYDSLAWYRRVVGDDYLPAVMVGRVASIVVARLANADVLPYDVAAFGEDFVAQIDALVTLAEERGVAFEGAAPMRRSARFLADVGVVARRVTEAQVEAGADDERLATTNIYMRDFAHRWAVDGLPERPWFRNICVAPDRDSGYRAWMLPVLRGAIEDGATSRLNRAVLEHRVLLNSAANRMNKLCTEVAGSLGLQGEEYVGPPAP